MKKNDDAIVQIQRLKKNNEDLTKQIEGMSGNQSKLISLKQGLSERENTLKKITEKISKTQSEVFSYEKKIQEKKSQAEKIQERKKKFLENLESLSGDPQDEFSSVLLHIDSQKQQINDLNRQLAKISSIGSDPYFLLTKSEQRLQNLTEKHSELLEYYNPDLVLQMEKAIPAMEQESQALDLKIEEAVNARKEFSLETERLKENIAELEDSYVEKKIEAREKQAILRNLEEEVKFFELECDRLNKLRERVVRQVAVEDTSSERIQKLRNDIYEIEKLLKTKENNYSNGIRSVSIRISKINSHISELKKDIRTVLEKISKVKKN
jgi:chromosome segregation ATPase